MSAPQTNLEKQKRRHWGPLLGMGAGLVFVAVLTVWFIGWIISASKEPAGADVQIDGRTGDPVVTEE